MFFIDLNFNGFIAEYFETKLLTEKEHVLLNGKYVIKGRLNWPSLKNIMIILTLSIFIFIEMIIYFISRYSAKKSRTMTINDIDNRIEQLVKGQTPNNKSDEYKNIDFRINKLIDSIKITKQQASLEMSKRNDVVTYLAHDLKTPLTVIIGYLTIINDSDVPETIKKKYIETVLEKSYALEDLTNQFFDITRFELQDIPINKSSLSAEFFLEQITQELYPLLQDKELKFDINIASGMNLYVDGTLFSRVLNNLLKNAIVYSNKNSVIKITGVTKEDNVQLSIENDSQTIGEQELELMFKKFYRRDQSRNQYSGSGLGLAIAKEIIQKHQGTISAQSNNGHIVFIITLPKD